MDPRAEIEPGLVPPECPFRRAVVVCNPASGRGRGPRAARELAEGLRRAGLAVELHATRGRGDAVRHLRSLPSRPDLVFAVGGDGTLREVLEGLVDPETPVGCLPAGTANVLASVLGLPRDVPRALELARAGRTRALDAASVDGRLSILCVGVGFDGAAVHGAAAGGRHPRGLGRYAWHALRALASFRPRPLRVTLDGQALEEPVGSLLVANTSRWAGPVKLWPHGQPDDGVLEVYLFPTARRAELAGALLRGLVGRLPGGAVRMRRARVVTVAADEPVPCQIDGDTGGRTPISIEVLPRRFRILVP